MTDNQRVTGGQQGSEEISPGGPKVPAETTTPSDPAPAPPGRSAGGQGAEVQVPLASPEKSSPGREAPGPEVAAGAERLVEGTDAPRLVSDPSDAPIRRGEPEGE